ncbi:SDR family oxidoreductase [Altericista sp. CCNU0014]|uniref:SDR family oxidoreductase n=1 Tax=Altericista sp. CCNU0014 TaxID=3082949 RepID=UPI00384DE74D
MSKIDGLTIKPNLYLNPLENLHPDSERVKFRKGEVKEIDIKGGFGMNISNILVTGGIGALGSLVVDCLQTADRNVQILSRSERSGAVQGDLLTGQGLEQAVKGMDTIVHCASSPTNPRQVDVEGTKRLLRAAEQVYPYYAAKYEVEQTIEQASIPWTILRATQFHEFVLMPNEPSMWS